MTAVGAGRDNATGAPQESDDTALADVIAQLRRAMRRAARLNDPTNTLSVAQLELLSCLAENPDSRPSELARLLRLAPNSVTTLVNGLHARLLVDRVSSATDRRAVSLAITTAGEQAVRAWQATNSGILSRALDELEPATRRLVTSAVPGLSELVHAIDAVGPLPDVSTAEVEDGRSGS